MFVRIFSIYLFTRCPYTCQGLPKINQPVHINAGPGTNEFKFKMKHLVLEQQERKFTGQEVKEDKRCQLVSKNLEYRLIRMKQLNQGIEMALLPKLWEIIVDGFNCFTKDDPEPFCPAPSIIDQNTM
ncbi:unnamed protein product [Schistosoma mattheei]|uniref:Uncharacterized protein n=1 Tax=Schistosoma mattheei TaxID=31246 RepID=A0AA85BQL2_9TREM|nr:unnamed protein product [Schistosoma mattheei]